MQLRSECVVFFDSAGRGRAPLGAGLGEDAERGADDVVDDLREGMLLPGEQLDSSAAPAARAARYRRARGGTGEGGGDVEVARGGGEDGGCGGRRGRLRQLRNSELRTVRTEGAACERGGEVKRKRGEIDLRD